MRSNRVKNIILIIGVTIILILGFLFVQHVLVPNWISRGPRATSKLDIMNIEIPQLSLSKANLQYVNNIDSSFSLLVGTNSQTVANPSNLNTSKNTSAVKVESPKIDSQRGTYESRLNAYQL